MTTKIEVPPKNRYAHDCADCVYKGSFNLDGVRHDVYKCTAKATLGNESTIARYGDAGPDYWSSPTCMIPRLIREGDPIAIACRVVVNQG